MTNNVIIATLKISQWYPRKYDAKASRKVAELFGQSAASELGRFNKLLINIDSIKPLQKACRAVRATHYDMTTPWTDNGQRALPVALYNDYCKVIAEAKAEVDKLADEFALGTYALQREQAAVRLGELFNPEEYPSAAEVRARFGVEVKFAPVTDPDVVRWKLPQADADKIIADVKADLEKTTAASQEHVVQTVVSRAKEFVEKLKKWEDGDAKHLHATAVENLRDITDLVAKGLNVTCDTNLTDMAAELADRIQDVHIDQLKHGEALRKQKMREVDAVLDQFSGVFPS